MAVHSLIPLFVLEDFLGKVKSISSTGIIKRAVCEEFYNFAQQKYHVPQEFIGETYAEINLVTDKGIPIDITVGKYIKNSPTKKNILIVGTKGKIDLDMHENFLLIRSWNDLTIDKIDLVNTKSNRYYPIIKTGLEFFSGGNPFLIDLTSNQLESQRLILEILEKSKDIPIKLYHEGEHYSNILH